MKMRKISLFTLMFIIPVFILNAQTPLCTLDYSRVDQKKIIDFVENEENQGKVNFADLNSTCYSPNEPASYSIVTSTFTVKEKISKVWDAYLHISPALAYSGRIIRYGFLYSKSDDKIYYKEDVVDSMKIGQLLFFNLKLMGGLKKLAVAQEITDIDTMNKMVRFCYVENGKTEGSQQIRFEERSEGYTVITHETWYRSYSHFRDKNLYPFFHKRSIAELHRNIKLEYEKHNSLK